MKNKLSNKAQSNQFMKKTLVASALSALLMPLASFTTNAEEEKQWVGIYGEYYRADEMKIPNIQQYEEGEGLGLEYGIKYENDFGFRFEAMKFNLDNGQDRSELTGESMGLDALYFTDLAEIYAIGGFRYQTINEKTTLANIGIGKHWTINENWFVSTEAMAYHDFGEGYRDVSFKLGINYTWGTRRSTPLKMEPADTDNDGVDDSRDLCPATPMDVAVDNTGCAIPLDTDNDGVNDKEDRCPGTPSGAIVDIHGCEIKDEDKDGVYDRNDVCPNTPMGVKVDAQGCGIMEEKTLDQTLRVFFATNSDLIRDKDTASIEQFVEFLRVYPNTEVEIQGHASAPGNEDYNMALSERRAASVKTMLVNEYGVDASRITTKGYGETQLLDTANTAAAHAANRRIVARVSTVIEVPVKE